MNLTSLAQVRSWVGSQAGQTTDDALLSRLIIEASQTILNYLQRADLGYTAVTEVISGRGERKVQLRNWPVIEVSSLAINGVAIPESTSASVWGFFLEPVYGSSSGRAQNVGIRNHASTPYPIGAFPSGYGMTAYRATDGQAEREFPRGVGNIEVGYTYGYCVQDEAQTIPALTTYTITPAAPRGSYAQDLGVKLANGTALTKITSGTPTTGQYLPPDVTLSTPRLVYTFAAADAGQAVLLSYNYIPAPIEQACIEIVGERYKYKGRIGLASASLGGQETTSYIVDGLTKAIKSRLDPYRMVWGG